MSLENKGIQRIRQWMRRHIAKQAQTKSRREYDRRNGYKPFADDDERDVQGRSTINIGPIDPEFFSLK